MRPAADPARSPSPPGLAEALAGWRRLVIKVGSALVFDRAAGRPRTAWMRALAEELAARQARGGEVVLVTSGAIAFGRQVVAGRRSRPLRLEERQAAAAAGQIGLIAAWQEAFAAHGLPVAQILLTIGDLEDRRRYVNARNTVETLLQRGIVPIVNENDTVATQEIRFGDNDRLAARVAVLAEADGLLLLSDIDGFYTADPRRDAAARHVPVVAAIDEEVRRRAGPPATGSIGSGGMLTKVAAAEIATRAGVAVGITDGREMAPLGALAEGRMRGTLFLPRPVRASARKQWLKSRMLSDGVIVVDDGAARALARGASLLPAGVRRLEGDFGIGALVEIRDEAGRLLAQGLAGHDAATLRRIAGLRSADIVAALGAEAERPAVHRDDLALVEDAPAGDDERGREQDHGG